MTIRSSPSSKEFPVPPNSRPYGRFNLLSPLFSLLSVCRTFGVETLIYTCLSPTYLPKVEIQLHLSLLVGESASPFLPMVKERRLAGSAHAGCVVSDPYLLLGDEKGRSEKGGGGSKAYMPAAHPSLIVIAGSRFSCNGAGTSLCGHDVWEGRRGTGRARYKFVIHDNSNARVLLCSSSLHFRCQISDHPSFSSSIHPFVSFSPLPTMLFRGFTIRL